MDFPETSTDNSKILGKHIHEASIDGAPPSDDTIAGDDLLFQPETVAPMDNKRICFMEGSLVQEQIETLPGG
jgi:hypothetical protein